MEALFLQIVNMSITASYVLLAVFLIRLLLQKAPKKYAYLLWSVVAFRLSSPMSFSAMISIFNASPFDMTVAQSGGGAALAITTPPPNCATSSSPPHARGPLNVIRGPRTPSP
ncbi:MAG: hypothetical protein K6T85_08000, partial [Gorillibacterium sp.]|nr:hypothetical protein [Gorillibacterium sp.]